MDVFDALILAVALIIHSGILRRHRRGDEWLPTLRNKVLAICWMVGNVALGIALLMSAPGGWRKSFELAIVLNQMWPLFVK
jgi:hypothetical protein